MINTMDCSRFSLELLHWFHKVNYNFPWRNTHNPYFIWLSEVMLQQTRVSQVLPYYQRLISSVPDFKSVSTAYIDDILKLWEGLGYYSRARNFHRACHIIVQKYGGTSVADSQKIKNVAKRITQSHKDGNLVVVVVSAMGGSTDQLIKLALEI